MVHQQCLRQVKVFFLPEWKKLTRRWKTFIAYSVERSLSLRGCRRSWMLWWTAIQFLVINVALLTLTLLTWRIWWAPNNVSKWQMGINSAFKWLRNRFLARSTQILVPTTCIYFVLLRSGRGNVLQVAVTLRTVIETLLSEKSSRISKVLEVWVIIWDTLSFTYSIICRNHLIVYVI